MTKVIGKLSQALICACAIASSTLTLAQTFPARPIRIIVPYTAGGPVDILARAISVGLSNSLGQAVIVDNKPGANSIIGTDMVAKAPPDGYTLLLTSDAAISINPLLYAKLPYSADDFAPLTVISHVPEYLFVSADVPANTLQEFIALAKSRPGQLNYGSFGRGSSGNLEFEALKAASGTDIVHIPFKGAADMYPAMLGGRIESAISSAGVPLPQVKAGKIKALAVMTDQRTTLLPHVPTFKESGLSGFDISPWFGMLVPAKTPPAIAEKLAMEIGKIIAMPDFREKYIDAIGLSPAPAGQTYFANLLKADRERYAKYVKIAGVTPE